MNTRKLIAGAVTALLVGGGLAVATILPASATGNHDCVPSEAWTEVITPEVPAVAEVPAVDAVYETITIKEAGWQRYSYKGKWKSDDAPSFPGDKWQANTASDPHGIGVEGAYFRSNGNSGHGDWFYLEATPAETEQRLVSEAVPAVPGQDAIPAVTIEHEAVVCEEEPPVVPEKPEPVAVVTATTGEFDCDSTTVTDTVTTTFVGHVLVDNAWVVNPLPSDKSKTEEVVRDLTTEETDSLDCAVVVPPVVEPPVVVPPVVEPPVEVTPPVKVDEVVTPVKVAQVASPVTSLPETPSLAYTGSNDSSTLIGGLVSLLLGVAAVIGAAVRRRMQV